MLHSVRNPWVKINGFHQNMWTQNLCDGAGFRHIEKDIIQQQKTTRYKNKKKKQTHQLVGNHHSKANIDQAHGERGLKEALYMIHISRDIY